MQKRWDGPFDEGRVFNFLVKMREGATAYLYRTYRDVSVEEAEMLGWFRKERGARFSASTSGLGQRAFGDSFPLREAFRDFVATAPEYVVHDSQWTPDELLDPPTSVTQGLREMVRHVIEDPTSGGSRWLNKSPEVLDELAPTAEKAFGGFEQAPPPSPDTW